MISNYKNFEKQKIYELSTNLDYKMITVDKFEFFRSKIEPLLNYIKTINNKYILYLDARDALLHSDIENAKQILDFYKCKILFNCEAGYSFCDHPKLSKHYRKEENYYELMKQVDYSIKERLHKKIKTNGSSYGLNAGVFLAEREFLIIILHKILYFMKNSYHKKYPYGEQDDQLLWRYMMYLHQDEIEIDFFNKFFMWGYKERFEHDINDSRHFNYIYNLNQGIIGNSNE